MIAPVGQIFWQMPHFLALAALYRRDYARAGFRVLSVTDPDGASSGRQSVLYALALLPEAQLIELCLLIGHYEMLAMTLNALRVQPEG